MSLWARDPVEAAALVCIAGSFRPGNIRSLPPALPCCTGGVVCVQLLVPHLPPRAAARCAVATIDAKPITKRSRNDGCNLIEWTCSDLQSVKNGRGNFSVFDLEKEAGYALSTL